MHSSSSTGYSKSPLAIAELVSRPALWRAIVLGTLAFWLSSSVILDVVIMPSLYATGMLVQPDFASAGYSIFWIFNRVELVCAALVLTGVLVLQSGQLFVKLNGNFLALGVGLMAIAFVYTYGLTPEMSALGMQLNLFSPAIQPPALMDRLHEGYWLLEVVKLVVGGTLLSLCCRRSSLVQ